uniref:Nucleotidyl transferase domain-containing protein n=1 Tax=Coccolithus braarudii TaxID=221442 RepID=A0A7S0LLM0_9EUKA
MILWVLDNLNLQPKDALVIVYDPGFIPPKFWEPIQEKYPTLSLVQLPGPTRGAAETVMIGLRGISKALRSRPVMLVDGDTFYEEDIVSKYREVATSANGVFWFADTQPKPLYSYIVFDAASRRITQVKEKVKISNHANSGCYCFMSGSELESQCQALLDGGSTQLSQDAVGEYYTSGVIGQMIEEGRAFTALQVLPEKMHVLGTPKQLQDFCLLRPHQPAIRFCFDLDHTLVTGPKVSGDYSTCEPIAENIAVCRALYEQGHYIIIATGRRMRTHKGNVAAVIADIGEVTIAKLKEFRIPYHELSFGKPWAQFYIDDLAVSAFRDLHKETGFYLGAPRCSAAPSSSAAAPKPVPAVTPPSAVPSPNWSLSSPSWPLLLLVAALSAAAGVLAGKKLR